MDLLDRHKRLLARRSARPFLLLVLFVGLRESNQGCEHLNYLSGSCDPGPWTARPDGSITCPEVKPYFDKQIANGIRPQEAGKILAIPSKPVNISIISFPVKGRGLYLICEWIFYCLTLRHHMQSRGLSRGSTLTAGREVVAAKELDPKVCDHLYTFRLRDYRKPDRG